MSVSVSVVRSIVDVVGRYGEDLRARLHLDWRRLEQPEARFELDELEQVVSAAVAVTGDEALGLHIGESVSEAAGDLVAHMMVHASTMRQAVEICAQFIRLMMDGPLMLPRDEGDAFVIRHVFPQSSPLCRRVFSELTMAGLVRLARTFVDPSIAPLFAAFEHERPAYAREYSRIFGGAQRFGQSATEIAFERAIADRPQLHRHPELVELLRDEAQRRLDRLATDARSVTRVREYVLALQPARIPEISTVASLLGMSERSLRRRLADDGTSYREIVRSVLEASAGRMLRNPRTPIKETAAVLGFGDTAAFNRAFKRWTGMTPGEYRRTGGGG